jgi:hypothetical protein
MPKLSEEAWAFIESVKTPEGLAKFEKEAKAEIRKENPNLSDEAVEARWKYIRSVI